MARKRKTYGTTRSGRMIDDVLVDELAAEAGRGYDVDEIIRRCAAKPPTGSRPTGTRESPPDEPRGDAQP